MKAVILSIGDELVLGQTVDSNSAYLAAKLAESGIGSLYHETLPDDQAMIADAIRRASGQAGCVLITGGLGPTKDDLTRQALADAMGVQTHEDPKSLEHIQAFFDGRGIVMSDANRVQALLPVGAQMIENARGTAPGIQAKLNGASIFVMPGVPHEMRAMVDTTILPALKQHAGTSRTILTTKVNTFGMGESAVGELLDGLMTRDRNPTVGTTVANGIVSVRVRSVFEDPAEARTALEDTVKQVTEIMGPITFGRDDQTLAEALVDSLKQAGQTVATAESCTGGLIGKMITDIAGSSLVYQGGWVTYTNEMKQGQLSVPENLFVEHGAVSGPVVCAMAAGALERSGADLAVSVSGVAGPGGGTDDKPVGTVWLGLAYQPDTGEPIASAIQIRLPGDRPSIRRRASMCALQWLRLHLAGHPPTEMTWVVNTYPTS